MKNHKVAIAFLLCLMVGIVVLFYVRKEPLNFKFNLSIGLIIIGFIGFIGHLALKWFRKSIVKKIAAGIFSLIGLGVLSIVIIGYIDARILLPAVSSTPVTKMQWLEDFEVMHNSLKEHPVYNDSLEGIINKLKYDFENKSGNLDHLALITGIRMVGLFNDSHSLMMPLPLYLKNPKYLPIQTYVFWDGIYITKASNTDLIGARIISINNHPIDVVYDKVASLIGADNSWGAKNHSSLYVPNIDVLKGLDIVSSAEEVILELEIDGKKINKKLKGVSAVKWSLWALSSSEEKQPVGWNLRTPKIDVETKNDYTLWMTFNEIGQETVLTDIGNKIYNQFYGKEINHFVIDLRNNGGGDNYTYNGLIEKLSQSDIKITLLTSRKTYSAAINFISELQLTGKKFRIIGEPTGAGHNHSGDPNTIFLPNSGLMVNISTKSWHFIPELTDNSIPPDVFIEYNSSDYFEKNDPWMKALRLELTKNR